MNANSELQTADVAADRRARTVWIVLAFATFLFIGLCSVSAATLASFAAGVTVKKVAILEVKQGPQLFVIRSGNIVPEVVERSTDLFEGDLVESGADSAAFISLWDDSRLQTANDTRLELRLLRERQFFEAQEEVELYLDEGTVIVSTSDASRYKSVRYRVVTDQAVVEIAPSSRVSVQSMTEAGQPVSQVIAHDGVATLLSRGASITLQAGKMARVAGDAAPEGPVEAGVELVRNGDFSEPPTVPAEESSGGGLDTAAWLPIRELSTEDNGGSGSASVEVIEEKQPDLSTVRLAKIKGSSEQQVVRAGLVQEVNRAVEYFDTIEFRANINLVTQTEPAGGRQGNLFPLTVRISYSDTENRAKEWQRSFYYEGNFEETRTPTLFKLNKLSWTGTDSLTATDQSDSATDTSGLSEAFMLKSATVGQDIVRIDKIEIFGFGTQYESWITDISLLAR